MQSVCQLKNLVCANVISKAKVADCSTVSVVIFTIDKKNFCFLDMEKFCPFKMGNFCLLDMVKLCFLN